jgi:SpoVK/Ycf46/Vps4 family AAA+-type ATPase
MYYESLWDGLLSSTSDRILVLGATNRFLDIDKAILRRMPKQFAIKLPDTAQRKKVLNIVSYGRVCGATLFIDTAPA